MSLCVSVGLLDQLREHDQEGYDHHRDAFARLASYMVSEGHAAYSEPENMTFQLPAHVSSFPYSFLHYLRRAYAHAHAGKLPLQPCAEGEDPADDDYIDDELTLHMSSHLVCHSDCEGYYVPINFTDVLYPDDEMGIVGGMVGSSQCLLAELGLAAQAIGIPLDPTGKLKAETHAELLAVQDESSGPFWREKIVWLALWVTAEASIEHKTAIVFG